MTDRMVWGLFFFVFWRFCLIGVRYTATRRQRCGRFPRIVVWHNSSTGCWAIARGIEREMELTSVVSCTAGSKSSRSSGGKRSRRGGRKMALIFGLALEIHVGHARKRTDKPSTDEAVPWDPIRNRTEFNTQLGLGQGNIASKSHPLDCCHRRSCNSHRVVETVWWTPDSSRCGFDSDLSRPYLKHTNTHTHTHTHKPTTSIGTTQVLNAHAWGS